MDDLPSVQRGPRQTDSASQTGAGTPRSADDGCQEAGAAPDHETTQDERAAVVGATSSSHAADADDLDVNRSGSGGSGGASTIEPDTEGSSPQSMDELLGGDSEGSSR